MAEDPELERRLEAMFASAAPRRGFEDELWRRIEARRPWYVRAGRHFQPALRYAPALATLLVVAMGVTWLAGNFRGGGAGSATTAGAPAPAFGEKNASLPPALGVLPRLASGARSTTAPQTAAAGADVAAGLTFSGTIPSLPPALPAYRYDEPSAADRAAAAARLKSQTGLTVVVRGSDAAGGREPQFFASGPAPAGSAITASAFLAGHNLAPHFTFQVSAAPSGLQVVYGRLFDGPIGPIRQVRPDGTAAGLSVDLGGSLASAAGPLDLPLTSASYPLRRGGDALSAVNVRQVPGAVGAFDHAELVYVVVVAGGHGYYEPELLLTGPGGAVFAAVVAPEWLGR